MAASCLGAFGKSPPTSAVIIQLPLIDSKVDALLGERAHAASNELLSSPAPATAELEMENALRFECASEKELVKQAEGIVPQN